MPSINESDVTELAAVELVVSSLGERPTYVISGQVVVLGVVTNHAHVVVRAVRLIKRQLFLSAPLLR